jgi:hypothetical protein
MVRNKLFILLPPRQNHLVNLTFNLLTNALHPPGRHAITSSGLWVEGAESTIVPGALGSEARLDTCQQVLCECCRDRVLRTLFVIFDLVVHGVEYVHALNTSSCGSVLQVEARLLDYIQHGPYRFGQMQAAIIENVALQDISIC